MGNAHRLTTVQLVTLLIVSAAIGACTTLGISRSASARAEGVGVELVGQKTGGETREKKKAGKPVVHFEIGCRNSAKTSDFYAKLFNWELHAQPLGATIKTGSKKGINGHITALGHDPQNYITFYVEVEDIKSYLEKANAMGGKTVVPAVKMPTGYFAWLADPDGNIVGLLQPEKPALHQFEM